MAKQQTPPKTFETAVEELEKILTLIEGGELGLEETLVKYERGNFLIQHCREVLNAAEHFMCTNVEWDPTGRYVATSVTSIHQMENGFNIWLFNGTLLYRCAARPFSFCAW